MNPSDLAILEASDLGRTMAICNRAKQEYELAARQVEKFSKKLAEELGSSTGSGSFVFAVDNSQVLLAAPENNSNGWAFELMPVHCLNESDVVCTRGVEANTVLAIGP